MGIVSRGCYAPRQPFGLALWYAGPDAVSNVIGLNRKRFGRKLSMI
jgi:hypothetical protein